MNLIPWRQKRQTQNGNGSRQTSLARLRDEVDTLFDRFAADPWGSSFLEPFALRLGAMPRVDVAESEDEVTIKAELPGVDSKDVDISVVGNVLTIRGEKKQEHEEKDRNYHYVERGFGRFQRNVRLPSSVDADKVDAAYKNGVLTVTVQKRPDARPKRIPVKTD